MSLLSVLNLLNLPPPPKQRSASQAVAEEAQRALKLFLAEVGSLVRSGDAKAPALREIAVAAGDEARKGAWDRVKKKIEQARKLVNVDAGDPGPTDSAVDPGAAEQSLADFAKDIKDTVGKINKMRAVMSSAKGDGRAAKALASTSEALGRVAEGLGEVGGAAEKLLRVAAIVRKIQECRAVLARARAADLSRDPVEGAKAMGDLAKLFGEFGAEATEEVPPLKVYFVLISHLGEICVPFAQMVERRSRELDKVEEDDQADAPREPKSPAADNSRVVAPKDLPAFLDENQNRLGASDLDYAVRQARDIRSGHGESFDELLAKLLALLDQSHDIAHTIRRKVGELTHEKLVPDKYFQKSLRDAWHACHEIVEELEKQLGGFAWMGVSYLPALRSLKDIKPDGA